MSLSKDLISQFVKATKDATTVKKESTVYGTVVKYNEKTYVKIDGSDLLTPAETLSSVEEGERVSIMIKDHTATITGNYTAPSASSIKVDGMDADLKANTANIKNLVAKNAEIENLVASKATIEDLRAANAEIDTLKSNYAEIETLVADKASIGDLEAVNADIKSLKADKADIAHLEANYATIGSLNAVYADITRLKADKADITDLNAINATIDNLKATKAEIDDLNAAVANIGTLTSDVANINTLINGNLTSDNIQSMVITGEKFTVENGFIKNAMIDSINANKINAGSINTNNVNIQSNDGSMILQGNLQQFKDENGKVRIQIGKDATGNFTFALYDENGTGQLINQNGIQSSNAIADGLIVDAKVADNANIAGSKLDIESVVTEINDGTTTIKGTKIYLDDKKQTLDLAFNSLSTTVENLKVASGDVGDLVEKVSTNTTNIQIAQGQISTLISNTTITKENGEVVQLKDEYNSTKDTVNSHTTKIGSLETNLDKANDNISSVSSKQAVLEQNLDGFKTTVSNTYATKSALKTATDNITSLTNRVQTAESKLTKDSLTTTIGNHYTTSNDVNGLITSKGYATTSQVTQTATDLTTKFSSSGGYNLLRNSNFANGANYWDGSITIDTSRKYNEHNSVKISVSGRTSNGWTGPSQRFAYNIPSGKTYTASLWYYVENKSTFDASFTLELKGRKTGASNDSNFIVVPILASNLVQGAWTRITVTGTTNCAWDYIYVYSWVEKNGTIWFTDIQVEEGPIATLWTPHPYEVYDGITQINKDGIKVYHTSIDSNSYSHMAPSGFYLKNKGEDIFKVDSNGLYLKGEITASKGTIGGYTIGEKNLVGTNVGMASSSDNGWAFWAGASNAGSAPFRVGHDGQLVATSATITGNVTITGGSVPSTILTGTIDNARLNNTIVNGASNGTSAKSTLDSKADGWDSTKSTVDDNKTNWTNAVNRVIEWASEDISGSTTINGGLIQTGTITAKQLYLGDLTNYCNLIDQSASLYGFTAEANNDGTWFKLNTNNRDVCISGNKQNDYAYYKCNGGETFRIKYQMKSDVKGSSSKGGTTVDYVYVNIGIYGKNASGNNFYAVSNLGGKSDSGSTVQSCNYTVTLPNDARTFGVFLQLAGWDSWSGTCRIKNVQVVKMSSGELIVDGAITADKIAANAITSNKLSADAITGKTITGGIINGTEINGSTINSDSFVGDVLAIDGIISAKSLQVQDIDSAKYPATLDGNVNLYVNSSSGNDDIEVDDDARFKTLQGAIDAIPKFLNNKTVYITMETDSTEDVSMRGIVGGAIRIYMNGKTLYGTLRSYVCAASINIYGGTRSSNEGSTGVIHPSVGISFGGRAVSVGFEASQYAAIYKVKVFAPDSLPSGVTNKDKVCVASQSGTGSVYCKNIQIVNAVIGFRSNNVGAMHVNSSSGVASKYGFQATTGGLITIANNAQAGGKTGSTNKSAGGQVIYDADGPTFATGNQSTDGGTAPVVPTTKTITIKSSYGDTYRSSVYNNWKKDGTVRQGDYGYGDCNGCWFFGSAFAEVKGATIKKVTITITRQSGGSSSAVGLVVKSHGHSSRPSGAPTFRTTAGTLSLATGKSGPLEITNSTILSEISSGKVKGFGIQSTYNSSHYAVCSGSVTVKIEYQE